MNDHNAMVKRRCPACNKALLWDPIWGFGEEHPEFCFNMPEAAPQLAEGAKRMSYSTIITWHNMLEVQPQNQRRILAIMPISGGEDGCYISLYTVTGEGLWEGYDDPHAWPFTDFTYWAELPALPGQS